MKKSILLSAFIFAVFTIFLSCNSKSALEKRCEDWNASEAFEQELTAVNNAALTYGQNPTTENCEAYRSAYLDYIDALRGWEDCYGFYNLQEEFNEALDDAEDAANNLDCN